MPILSRFCVCGSFTVQKLLNKLKNQQMYELCLIFKLAAGEEVLCTETAGTDHIRYIVIWWGKRTLSVVYLSYSLRGSRMTSQSGGAAWQVIICRCRHTPEGEAGEFCACWSNNLKMMSRFFFLFFFSLELNKNKQSENEEQSRLVRSQEVWAAAARGHSVLGSLGGRFAILLDYIFVNPVL